MELFQCPYLGTTVDLAEERGRHIRTEHSELPPDLPNYIAGALASPDLITRNRRKDGTIHFYRWYYDLNKYMVVIVASDSGLPARIVTAYISDRVRRGEILWQRI